MNSIVRACSAALGLAITFTFSCGQHSLEEISFGSSSSTDEGYSSSSLNGISSSSQQQSSSSGKGSSSSSSAQPVVVYGDPVIYGDETYQTVVIGMQTWFQRNLNYYVEGSVCYNNDPANCEKYGRLYNWATAMALDASCNSNRCSGQITEKHKGICPSGWHIPSNDEWNVLVTAVGGREKAGIKLKATKGWKSGIIGTDNYGFAALPGGYYIGGFDDVGGSGNWWSATGYNAYNAYARYIFYDIDSFISGNDNKSELYSIRCLQGGFGSSYGLSLRRFNIVDDKTTVSINEEFTVDHSLSDVNSTTFPGATSGVALMDENDNIIAILGTLEIAPISNSNRAVAKKINCKVPDTVTPGQYKLRIVVKTKGNDEWRVVISTEGSVQTFIDFTIQKEGIKK
jgi:uncharacterized protein (TIGR02145 family)